MRWQIRKNLYKTPTVTLPLNLPLTEIVQNRMSEVVRISHLVKFVGIGRKISTPDPRTLLSFFFFFVNQTSINVTDSLFI